MSQFEQDIRTSLNTIQTQLAAVQNRADGANASIARMGTTAKVAAGGVGDIEKSMGKVTAAATRAGGPIAGMVSQLGSLAAFNPLALAAGAAIGGITAGVYALIAALREANAEQEKLNATVAAAPGMAKAAGVEALAEADPNMLRYGISTEQRKRNLEEFQKSAPGADRTVDLSTEEGRANFALFGGRRVGMTPQQREQIELGMADADPAAARNAILRAQASQGGQMADEAERIQNDRSISEAARQERLLRVGAGVATPAQRTQAAIDSSPELKQSLDALNETLKQQRAAVGGMQFLGSQERAEAAVRETEERIQTIRNQVGQASY
jgi:hypothetical protein